jgi:hypothetical protein
MSYRPSSVATVAVVVEEELVLQYEEAVVPIAENALPLLALFQTALPLWQEDLHATLQLGQPIG